MKDQSKPALAVLGQNGSRPAVPARAIPNNLAVKCPKCREVIVGKDWEKNSKVCPRCKYHARLTAWERIKLLADGDSWDEFGRDLRAADPLHFTNHVHPYPSEIQEKRDATSLDEAAVIVRATIDEMPVVLAVLDFSFIGGSMGSVVGEKVTLAIEAAAHDRVPLIVVSASGGARMQEGMFALMQMAKTSAALAKLAEAGVSYISVLTDPTTGGTLASYAFLGDVILAEPGAFIGFAGPRVIEQAIHTKLPAGTNSSEFVLQHGMIDAIVARSALKPALSRLVKLYRGAQGAIS